MLRVHFEPGGESDVRTGDNELITECLRRAGTPLNTQCGERGVCRGCEVTLLDGEYRVGGESVVVGGDAPPRLVRGCQTRLVPGSKSISIPGRSLLPSAAQVEEGFLLHEFSFSRMYECLDVMLPLSRLSERCTEIELLWRTIGVEPETAGQIDLALMRQLSLALAGNPSRKIQVVVHRTDDMTNIVGLAAKGLKTVPLGLAVDVGTTTLVALLVDLSTGEILAKASGYNEQIRLADDVASRLGMADDPERLSELRRLVIEESLNKRIDELVESTGRRKDDIVAVSVSGNTVMTHLFAGISPFGIGTAPFQPIAHSYPTERAGSLGISVNPLARVNLIPSISGYVGGDVVADIYTSGLLARKGIVLLVDIGTNGEIVLCEEGKLFATSTAAGPAFEGRGVHCGMRATDGAIEHVQLDDKGGVTLKVIGRKKPVGLCGSAVVDFLAEAFKWEYVYPNGRFDVDAIRSISRYEAVNVFPDRDPAHGFVLVDAENSGMGRSVVITEYDIAEILKAKAAIYAGMKTLLEQHGRDIGDVSRMILAGGFARHLKISSAVAIGLLPELAPDQFVIQGNGSLAGAYLSLVERNALDTMAILAGLPANVELNLCPGFQDHYIEALAIPNLMEEDFPGRHTYPQEAE